MGMSGRLSACTEDIGHAAASRKPQGRHIESNNGGQSERQMYYLVMLAIQLHQELVIVNSQLQEGLGGTTM